MSKKSSILGGLKMLAMVAGLMVVAIVVVAARAEAKIVNELWNTGDNIGSLSEFDDPSGDPRTLFINGAEVTLRSESLDSDLDSALDRAEKSCNGLRLGPKSTTFRRQRTRRGFVACFTQLGRHGLSGIVRALRGETSELGEFHYTYVRATDAGVHQLRIELPQIDISLMFPERGDAPGVDVRGLPRPPLSQRLLSALEIDSPYHIAIYRIASATIDKLIATYQRELVASGWDLDPERRSRGRLIQVAHRGSRMVIITLHETKSSVIATVGTGL